MSDFYQEIHTKLKEIPAKQDESFDLNNYLGTESKILGLKTAERRDAIKEWVSEHKNLTIEEFTGLLDDLFESNIYEEKASAATLMFLYPHLRQEMDPMKLDEWLTHLVGWAEVDSLCQSTFRAGELSTKWETWEKLLKDLNKSENINKRRASIVLLCKPVKDSADEKFRELAFENINNLKEEKDILITKAISWILREMTNNHRAEVKEYVAKNQDSLPKIALREVSNKIKTGKK